MVDLREEKIDMEKVKTIRKLLYAREVLNLKTGKYKDAEMKMKLKEVIEKEVDKCY